MSQNNRAHRIGTASLLAAGLILFLVWPTVTQAQYVQYSLSGNSRSQIGDTLPLPITFAPAPQGKVVLPANAVAFQTTGPDPKAIKLVKKATPAFDAATATIGVHNGNKAVFQVRTSLIVRAPLAGTAVLQAGGRSGQQTMAWCPGSPGPASSANPNCLSANPTNPGQTFPARLVYFGTATQFGGVSRPEVGGGTKGGASVVLKAGINAPCTHTKLGGADVNCLGAFSAIAVNTQGVNGGTLVKAYQSSLGTPIPIHPVKVAANGLVNSAGPTTVGFFPANAVLTYGAPWTTGKVVVSAPSALGAGEKFTITGSDNRVSGIGSLSLVAGGLSTRALSGDNANQNWQNLQLDAFAVPSISNGGLVLLSALLLAATAWMLRRAVVASN